MIRGGWSRRRYLLVATGVGVLLLALAAWLGSEEMVGTFGVTGQAKSCGSVWGLPSTSDLNAASCQDDLRARLSLVAILIGLGGAVGLVAAIVARDSPRGEGSGPPLAIGLAIAVPLAVAVLMIRVGRHLIWSVSGA